MRSIPSIAALLAWVMVQLPGVVCVCDCGDVTQGSLLVHEQDHEHGHAHHHHETCDCCEHDHEHEHGDDEHGHAHLVIHIQSSMADAAVVLAAPVVDAAVDDALLAPITVIVDEARWERDTGPPRPTDPVSASDRLIV